MRFRLLPIAVCVLLATLFVFSVAQAQPSHTTYQGSLFKDGSAYTGNANFKFAIIDGGVTLWSNDGTSVAGSEPTASVVLSVDQGIFTAFLGQGMDSLSADELAGSTAPVLRVWVDTGGGFDQLSDQTMSSSTFAMQSDSAERSLGGFVANGVIHSTTGGIKFPDNTVQTTAGGLPGGASYQTLRHDGAAWAADSTLLNDGTNVGIGGFIFPTMRLYVGSDLDYGIYSAVTGTYGIYGTNSNTSGYGVYGRANSSTGSNTGVFGLTLSTSGRGVYGSATASTGTNYGVYGYSNSTSGRGVFGYNSRTTGFTYGVYGQASSSDGRGVYGLGNLSTGNNYGVYGRSISTTGTGVFGEATNASGPNYGVRGSAVSSLGYAVHGTNSSSGGYAVYSNGRLRATSSFTGSSNGWLNLMETTGNLSSVQTLLQLEIPITSSSTAYFIEAMTKDGDRQFTVERTGTVRADGNVYAAGHFSGSADFAEMLPGDAYLEPGDVLAIGSDGEITGSTRALQTNVAGVYSTKPGFVGGAASEEDMIGKIPLAIVGIVPAKVSGENGNIKPGDLLVTSSIAGHAMRHDNPPPGTIVGKALEGLSGNTGVIKMLVTLQ